MNLSLTVDVMLLKSNQILIGLKSNEMLPKTGRSSLQQGVSRSFSPLN
jgi:hypothetical protein